MLLWWTTPRTCTSSASSTSTGASSPPYTAWNNSIGTWLHLGVDVPSNQIARRPRLRTAFNSSLNTAWRLKSFGLMWKENYHSYLSSTAWCCTLTNEGDDWSGRWDERTRVVSQALSRFLETQPKQNWRQEIVNFDKEDFSYNVFPTWEEIW